MKYQVREVFNRLAGIYEHSVDTVSLFNSEYERPAMLEKIPQHLTGKTVLDAGCAAGWYTEQLAVRGADVFAIDSSEEMVNAAKRRIGNRAAVLHHDLDEPLPFNDKSFDFIVSSLTLHYLKDWERIFKEFQRILKPNGEFLFSVHHPFTDIQWLEQGDYFSTELIIDQWIKEGQSFNVPFYRRPLPAILNETLICFEIDQVIEPLPTAEFRTQKPEQADRLLKSPQFLIIKARAKS